MSQPPIITDPCFFCGRACRMAHGIYEGRQIPRYGVFACNRCLAAAWDGWGPMWELKLLEHLADTGRPTPERNAQGWLPRE